jgi:hypothetical protein
LGVVRIEEELPEFDLFLLVFLFFLLASSRKAVWSNGFFFVVSNGIESRLSKAWLPFFLFLPIGFGIGESSWGFKNLSNAVGSGLPIKSEEGRDDDDEGGEGEGTAGEGGVTIGVIAGSVGVVEGVVEGIGAGVTGMEFIGVTGVTGVDTVTGVIVEEGVVEGDVGVDKFDFLNFSFFLPWSGGTKVDGWVWRVEGEEVEGRGVLTDGSGEAVAGTTWGEGGDTGVMIGAGGVARDTGLGGSTGVGTGEDTGTDIVGAGWGDDADAGATDGEGGEREGEVGELTVCIAGVPTVSGVVVEGDCKEDMMAASFWFSSKFDNLGGGVWESVIVDNVCSCCCWNINNVCACVACALLFASAIFNRRSNNNLFCKEAADSGEEESTEGDEEAGEESVSIDNCVVEGELLCNDIDCNEVEPGPTIWPFPIDWSYGNGTTIPPCASSTTIIITTHINTNTTLVGIWRCTNNRFCNLAQKFDRVLLEEEEEEEEEW